MIIAATVLIAIVVTVGLFTIVLLNHENVLRLHPLCAIPLAAAKAKAYYIWGLGFRVYGFGFGDVAAGTQDPGFVSLTCNL